jgi:protein-disulfide isomerase
MSETTEKFSLNPSIAIIVAGVVIAGAIVYTNRYPAVAAVADANVPTTAAAAVNVPPPTSADHIIGSPDAPIVLIEYSDFQCPFCSVIYPTIKRIVSESNGEIAWVMRNFPLESIHPQARPAATAAECIAGLGGNNAFWKYADTVFNNQQQLNPSYSRQLALSFGIDAAQYDSCVAKDTYKDRIEAEVGDVVSNGGNGTPYTVVYSKNYQTAIPGALPYNQITAVIKSVKNRQ